MSFFPNDSLLAQVLFFQCLPHSFFSPLHVIKIRLQCQNEMLTTHTLTKLSHGPSSCMWMIRIHEGNIAFWKGNLSNIILNCLNQLTSSLFFQIFKEQYDTYDENFDDHWKKTLIDWFLSVATLVSSLGITYSLEFARTRLINDIQSKKYKGILDVYSKTMRSDGISGLYRGFSAFCLQIALFRAILFSYQDFIYPKLEKKYLHYSSFIEMGILGLAIYCFYPLETMSRRMMMRSGERNKYKGLMDCYQTIMKKEGYRAFYNGAGTYICTQAAMVTFALSWTWISGCFSVKWLSEIIKKFE